MKTTRRKFSASFKAKVAIEAIKEQTSLQELDNKSSIPDFGITIKNRCQQKMNAIKTGVYLERLRAYEENHSNSIVYSCNCCKRTIKPPNLEI